eukprot:1157660-Pelagomonas_calceolata.AAC.2
MQNRATLRAMYFSKSSFVVEGTHSSSEPTCLLFLDVGRVPSAYVVVLFFQTSRMIKGKLSPICNGLET